MALQATFHAVDEPPVLPPLFRDAFLKFQDLAPFFEYDPHDPASLDRRAAWLDARFQGDRAALARILFEANRSYGAAEPALDNARALAEPGTLAVVCGQQAGLFGGPLLTLYKAVTAVRLAAQAQERLGRRVVPVFWMASEDHDFDEVRRAFVLDRKGRIRELSVPPLARARSSVGALPVPRRLESLLQETADALGERLRHPEVLEAAARAASESRDWGEWFARLLAGWLSAHGLVILDPMQRPLRALLRDLYPVALVRREGIHRELAAAAARLERRGYAVQLAIEPDHCNLFFYENGMRLALHWDRGELVDRGGRVRLSVARATALMREEPWRFSPNVVLRPLAQDTLLPTLAFIAGPAETAYLAQMRDVYALFGMQMPVVQPRLSVTLVGPEVGERLRAYGVAAGAFLSGDPEEPLRRELRRRDRVGIDGCFRRLRDRVHQAYADTLRELEAVSPALPEIGRRNLDHVLAQIDYLEKKAQQHHRRAQRDAVRDLTYVRNALRPRDGLQERVLATLPALAEFGPRLVRWLLRVPAQAPHHLAVIEDAGARRPLAAGGGARS